MIRKNIKQVSLGILALSLILAGAFFFAKRDKSLASTANEPTTTGDVFPEDAEKINQAIDNFINTQKQAQEEYKLLEAKVLAARQSVDSTIVEIVTKNGKDWRNETIIEKDAKLRTYKFIKRDQPLPQPTPVATTKEEEKK